MPHTPRQYVRALLLKLGIGNAAAFHLNLDAIRESDVFLCSYPKSGNTWLRFLIAQLMSTRNDIHPHTIDELVPDVYMANEKANALTTPRMLKTHHALFKSYPKTIYIVRDVRDVMLSYYHYQKALGVFKGSLSEFIVVADQLHPFGTWAAHVQAALAFQQQYPKRIMIIRYEDLQQNPEEELKKLIVFSGIQPVRSIQEAIELSTFNRLRKLEREHGSAFQEKSGEQFFRSGKSGEAKQVLTAAENEALYQQHEQLLTALGYTR